MENISATWSERDLDEIKRSEIEASRIVLTPINVRRYASPPPDTAYALEFAYYLLGNVRGRKVLDLGCGSGENMVVLASRGADVIGIDISPHLVELARQRLSPMGKSDRARVATAYATGLPDESVDAVFAIAVLHHLDLTVVREEIRRVLRKNGLFIFSEPIRFSRALRTVRKLMPARDEVSSYEHPLDRGEIAEITKGFTILMQRNFQLPFVPLLGGRRVNHDKRIWEADRWLNLHFPKLEHYATLKVMSMRK